jgi:hypothetical protein
MSTYDKWLLSAYQYYWGLGSDMSDGEWDCIAREIAMEHSTAPHKFPELGKEPYEGGSLFWLKAKDYPQWIKDYK